MPKKKFFYFSLAWITFYLLLIYLSWAAWFSASRDLNSIYLPLRSFFLDLPSNIDLPNWILAHLEIKPEFKFKLIHEISMWLVIIPQISLYIYGYIKFKSCKNIKAQETKNQVQNKETTSNTTKENSKLVSIKDIFLLGATIATLSCFLIPQDSSDIYAYIARGSQQAIVKQNPYQQTVSSIENYEASPLFANSLWPDNPSPYGPLFMWICDLLVDISKGDFWLAFLFFKFFNLFVFLSMLWGLQGLLSKAPEEALNNKNLDTKTNREAIFYLFAINPLLTMECLWNGHNDIIIGALIFFAIYSVLKDRFNLAILFASLGVLVKYLSLVLIPIILVFLIRRSKNLLEVSKKSLVGLGLSLWLAWVFVDHYDLLGAKLGSIGGNLTLSHKSLFDSCNSLFKYISGADLPHWMVLVPLGLYGILYLFAAKRYLFGESKSLTHEQNSNRETIQKQFLKYSFLALFILICFASPKFHSWYLVIFLAPGLLVEAELMFLLSISHMLSFTFLDQANIANFLIMTALPTYVYYKKLKPKQKPSY